MNQAKVLSGHGVETHGWALTRSSNVIGHDMLKFGFTIQDDRLFPDTMEEITSRLGPSFEVTDRTRPGTTSLKGLPSRSVEVRRLAVVPSGSARTPPQESMPAAAVAPTGVPPEVLAALQRFAATNGRRWKSVLLTLWETGRDEREADGPLLRKMRINFGPSFLKKMRLPATIAV
ncbi:hypothetical protein [Paraburkholderia youngii]|uniref:hypothetical protein n=1 Tax=Paraburkholderia youngii TaxID=2782701 RepID=UPI003D1A8D6F